MDDREEDLRRLAADPATPLTTLQLLAQDHPEVRAAIAANPATYPALLEWLGALGMPDVDAALAARGAGAHATAAESEPSAAGNPASAATTGERPVGLEPPTTAHPAPVLPPVILPASRPRPVQAAAEPPTERIAALGPEQPPAAPASAGAEPGTGDQPTSLDDRAIVAGVRHSPGDVPGGATAAWPAAAQEATTSRLPARPGLVEPDSAEPGLDAPGRAEPGRPERTRPAAVGAAPDDGVGPGRDRRPAWALLALVAVLLVAGLGWALGRPGDDPAPSASPSATTTPASPPASPAPTSDPADAAGATLAALAALPGASSCADVSADAKVFADFGAAASSGDAWADPGAADVVMTALTGLQEACDPAYAVAVNDALVDGEGTPAALVTTLATAGEWVQPVRAAPPGAQPMNDFTSPSGNIACSLGETEASCTIGDRSFADPAGCAAGPVTLVVGTGGAAAPDCTRAAAPAAGTLPYGQSATAGLFACTSEQDGMTCWSTLTGSGFSVARAGFTTF
ncbi:hypothetical protein [Georgenia sp. AZ-5]|uniref:variant leucine-rich repeat-containing protein n=1 Tax=Georgenia sp. AZ-5 TaxID=3367526 RepID=UPI003754F829